MENGGKRMPENIESYKAKEYRKRVGYKTCVICNEEFFQSPTYIKLTPMMLTICEKPECYEKAIEYEQKKNKLVADFAREKERILRPWCEKYEVDMFLLDQEFLYKGSDS